MSSACAVPSFKTKVFQHRRDCPPTLTVTVQSLFKPVDRPWFPHHIGKTMHHNIWTGIATENAPALRARTHVHRIRFKLLLEPHTVAPHTVNTSDKVEKCVTCQSWVAELASPRSTFQQSARRRTLRRAPQRLRPCQDSKHSNTHTNRKPGQSEWACSGLCRYCVGAFGTRAWIVMK